MKEAGCYQMQFGIESGSERMLSLMNKRLNLSAARETLSACDRLGIETVAFFIMGYLGETQEDLGKTIHFIKETHPDFISLNPYINMPGSPLHKKTLSAMISNSAERTAEKLYRNYYFTPEYVLVRMKKLFRHPDYAILFIRQNLRFWRAREGELWRAIENE
ncbi:MAG: radical SAM protein [Candidatus Woesearchaeota archaeon]|nr:radical SAM protein [Candidatus Woesearchaeota archaeon]